MNPTLKDFGLPTQAGKKPIERTWGLTHTKEIDVQLGLHVVSADDDDDDDGGPRVLLNTLKVQITVQGEDISAVIREIPLTSAIRGDAEALGESILNCVQRALHLTPEARERKPGIEIG